MPIVVVGTASDERVNWTTIAYVGIVDSSHISLSMSSKRFSLQLLKKSGQFSINIPGREHMKLVDTLGLVSGNAIDKSSLVTYSLTSLVYAPVIDDFPLNLVCSVCDIRSYSEGSELVIGKVEEAYGTGSTTCSGTLEVRDVDPLLFAWDGYYTAGERIGIPWKEGK